MFIHLLVDMIKVEIPRKNFINFLRELFIAFEVFLVTSIIL